MLPPHLLPQQGYDLRGAKLQPLVLANRALVALGAEETQIEASFCAAIRIAKEQKSVSFAKRAEVTYAEYLRQKGNASPGHGFRLPL